MFELIRQGLRRRWVQSLSTVVALAVSVALLFALIDLHAGTSLGLRLGARRLGADLLVIPEKTVMDPETLLFTGAPANVYMSREIEGRIAQVPGVRRTSAQFFAQTLNETCCSLSGATRLIGYDPTSDWTVAAWTPDAGRHRLTADEILVGAGVEGVAGGKAFVLNRVLRVAAVLAPSGTSLDYSILMPIAEVRRLAQSIPYLRVFLGAGRAPEDLISAILVEADPQAEKEPIATAIERSGDLRVIRSADVLGNIKRQLRALFTVMLVSGGLSAMAAMVQLFARFFSLAWERKGEWGLYRALGATRRDLKLIVLGEAGLLVGAGVAGGLAFGGLLAWGLRAWLEQERAFPYIEGSWARTGLMGLCSAAACVLLVGLATWWPTRQSGRISPASAMAMGDID